MDLKAAFDAMAGLVRAIPSSELLIMAVAAMLGAWIGAVLVRRGQTLGRVIGSVSTLMLCGILVVVVLQLSHIDPRLELAISGGDPPRQVVTGGKTHIALAGDGHYWVRARINGETANFMIDTGATLTAVNGDLAKRAGLELRRGGLPVQLETAGGPVTAQLATARRLSFGNIEARGIDVVIVPELEGMNVIGMNVLSRLSGLRVEDGEMVLVPAGSAARER